MSTENACNCSYFRINANFATIMIALQLIGGFLLLFFGGDWLVDGGVAVARRFNISPLVIGLTIVAFGTSAPELLVSMESAMKGIEGIAMGNVIGSNIANIGLILGLTAMICPIVVEGMKSVLSNCLVMIGASVLAIVFSIDGCISRPEGAVMFLGLVAYTVISIMKGRGSNVSESDEKAPMSTLPALLLIVLSCAMLAYGADLMVEGATALARMIGVSDQVIGLTIVAFGTSLPELAASVAAAVKKQMDISIGNIVGSNLFNILCVLGLSATVSPISFTLDSYINDFAVMMLFSVGLTVLIQPWKQTGRLSRVSGALMFAAYAAYAYMLF